MSPAPLQDGNEHSEDGFTLVETLVAVALISLLSVLVLGALRFGIGAWQRGEQISNRMDAILHAQSFLRRLIANAQPHFVLQPGGQGYVDFEGRPTSLRLIADPSPALDRAGRLMMTLSVEQNDGLASLMISSRPELTAGGGKPSLTRRVLLGNIQKAEFSYFGSRGANGPRQWHSDWVGEAALPELVRIELRADEAALLPGIVVRPAIDVDISCIYDALTRRCRGR